MSRPPSVTCYICQREFGTRSIEIHEKQCLKRWQLENDNLPRSQQRPPPVKPAGFSFEAGQADQPIGSGSNTAAGMEAYNEAASRTAHANLAPCSKCGRRFARDRLDIHERCCNPIKAVKKYVYDPRKPDVDINLLRKPKDGKSLRANPAAMTVKPSSSMPRCRHCQRTFAADRIERHEGNCHAEPVNVVQQGQNTNVPKKSGSQFCMDCGQSIAVNARFCANCGTKIQSTSGNNQCQILASPIQAKDLRTVAKKIK